MVVESFITPDEARRNPWSLFLLGIVYSTIGILLALIIFPSQASITAVFLTTLASAPLFVSLMKSEEVTDERFFSQEKSVLFKHVDIISIFFFLFLGFAISFSFWFTFLPNWALQSVFSEQIGELNAMQNIVTGNLFNPDTFWTVLNNNVRVLFFLVVLSFIYGAGAVLILAWNASILGAAAGIFIKNEIGSLLGQDYLGSLAAYFTSLPAGLGQYMVHGTFEIIAYFIASLVGGLLSAAIIRKRYTSINFFKLLKNTTLLIAIALLLLIISAYIEVSL